MKRSAFLVLATLATMTGCSAQSFDEARAEESVDETSSDIIGGTVDNGDPSVVYLSVGCSGSVVSSTVVLTAAHCVDGRFDVRTGTNAGTSPTSVLTVKESHAHPKYNPSGPPDQKYDIAVVILAKPTNLTPLKIRNTQLTNSDIGGSVRLVGYGVNNGVTQTGDGIKRQVTVKLNGFDSDDISVGGAGKTACNVDSGGPAFYNGEIIGVTSYGTRNCPAEAYYTRTDLYKDFISQYVR